MQAQDTTDTLKPTRASFIRSLPESMPVDEVIERGREAGIVIQPSDIHSARYYMRQAATQQAPSPSKRGVLASELMRGNSASGKDKDKDKELGNENLRVVSPAQAVFGFAGRSAPVADKDSEEPRERNVISVTLPGNKPGKGEKGRGKRVEPVTITAPTAASTVSSEEQLRLLVFRVGITKARAIVDQVEASAPPLSDKIDI